MKLRVAIFGSFYRGEQLIRAILAFKHEHPRLIDFAGIATDDPFHPRTSPDKRVWQYLSDEEKAVHVRGIVTLAQAHKVPVWQGNIKGPKFASTFAAWKPDVVYMGTFGQRIPRHLFEQPAYGFLNFHPTVDHRKWPSYVGGNPFSEMIAQGERHGAIALHEVNEEFDDGPLISFSGNFRLLPNDTVVALHQRTAVEAGKMVEWHLRELFGMPQPRYGIRAVAKPSQLRGLKPVSTSYLGRNLMMFQKRLRSLWTQRPAESIRQHSERF
jgi:folate-dependent phosphoribosylglycinamide formyltransferase PurN